MLSWLEEKENGDITFDDKKFSAQRDSKFKEKKLGVIMSEDGREAARLLLNRQINSFLGTKVYNVEFLKEHKIKFDEQLDDETAKFAFQKDAFSNTKYFMYLTSALYVVPLQ